MAYPELSLLDELVTAATGSDSSATGAWVQEYLKDSAELKRVNAHWDKADEPLQMALASFLGLVPPTGERLPIPSFIWDDYLWVMHKVNSMFDTEFM